MGDKKDKIHLAALTVTLFLSVIFLFGCGKNTVRETAVVEELILEDKYDCPLEELFPYLILLSENSSANSLYSFLRVLNLSYSYNSFLNSSQISAISCISSSDTSSLKS